MAAMRFDLASLLTMPRLQQLVVDALGDEYTKQDVNSYMICQHKIPSDSTSTTATDQQYGIFGSFSFQEWSLPKLNFLCIQGPPCSIFCLEYLRHFPALNLLVMNYDGSDPMELNRYPLYAQLDCGSVKFTPRTATIDTTQFTASHLTMLNLYGNWVMSSADLTSLLTTYAPYLENIRMDNLQCHASSGVYKVIEAIHQADKENDPFNDMDALNAINIYSSHRDKVKVAGKYLGTVRSHLELSDQEAQEHGLISHNKLRTLSSSWIEVRAYHFGSYHAYMAIQVIED
ncbi:hypothetical protein BGZ76_001930 [Entomortierella beljakovae]|nr:hypothetical protein BGZ76_001930 [Entomortierella beljakovae]